MVEVIGPGAVRPRGGIEAVLRCFELVIFLFLGSVAVVNWFCFGWVPDRVLLGWVT